MSIPLILASKSKPRRDVLYSAGICPTIRVSHVDEPAALEAAAREEGVTVDDLSIKQRVMILATAKAEARIITRCYSPHPSMPPPHISRIPRTTRPDWQIPPRSPST